MTSRERAERAVGAFWVESANLTLSQAITREIDDAVAEERERCAKIALCGSVLICLSILAVALLSYWTIHSGLAMLGVGAARWSDINIVPAQYITRRIAAEIREGNVQRHTFERLDSFVDGVAGKRLTYARLIA